MTDNDIDFHIDRLLDKLWHDGEGYFYDALTALVAKRDTLKQQRDKARLLISDLLDGTGNSRSNAIALLNNCNELEDRINQPKEGLQND